jgi:carboxyl-terminal processing protease
MNRKAGAVVFLLSFVVVGYVVAGVVLDNEHSDDGPYRQMGVYTEVLQHIANDYVTEPNLQKVTDGALHGLLESLDADSAFMNAQEYREYKSINHHTSGSIGAVVSKRIGYANVVDVIPGSPAASAGIARGDFLEEVAGQGTRDLSAVQIRSLLEGAPGTKVELNVVRVHAHKLDPEKVVVTRQLVKPPLVTEQLYDGSIGYIRVPDFSAGRAEQIAQQIKILTSQGAQKFILDVRDCGDGDFVEAAHTANLFLNHGVITYVEGQTYPRVTTAADPSRTVTEAPLIVLVNGGTAGPAEVVAGAILDNERGDLVGTKTYGEGSIQRVIEIGDGSAMLISTARYYRPNGKAIQEQAVTANIQQVAYAGALPDEDLPAMEQTEDLQLKRALEVLRTGNKNVTAAQAGFPSATAVN